jgi:hypothetical protein
MSRGPASGATKSWLASSKRAACEESQKSSRSPRRDCCSTRRCISADHGDDLFSDGRERAVARRGGDCWIARAPHKSMPLDAVTPMGAVLLREAKEQRPEQADGRRPIIEATVGRPCISLLLTPTSTNAIASSCAPARLAEEPRRDNVLSGKALLLADRRGHECVGASHARGATPPHAATLLLVNAGGRVSAQVVRLAPGGRPWRVRTAPLPIAC